MDAALSTLSGWPWGQILFMATFTGLSAALLMLAVRSGRENLWTRVLTTSGALALAVLTVLNVNDQRMFTTVRQDLADLRLRLDELGTTLRATESVRDHLTVELELAQDALRLSRTEVSRLLVRLEQSLDQASAGLEQIRNELILTRRPAPVAERAELPLAQRVEAMIAEIDRLGGIRARPSVKLEPKRADIDGDRAVILPPSATR